MAETIRKIIIVGGGTAGWMSAALLKRVLGPVVDIELVESEQIGIIGVGEATIPPIQHVNTVLGLDEPEFLRETKASIKLAIRFENWRAPGERYYHTFGAPGRSQAFCQFHHYWTRAEKCGLHSKLWDYDLNYLCAEANKFSKLKVSDPIWELPYAYHFDSSLYGRYLRRYSERLGVIRTEGLIDDASIHGESGEVRSLKLRDGREVSGDFYIDCSGGRALLIRQTLGVGFEDWGHWLPCDRAIAIPTERFDVTVPYTRSIAHAAGWQWRIPLQHRNGNGLVYSSRHYSDDEAAALLCAKLESPALAEPNLIPFRTGRTREQWSRNVVAVGLSSGFLEPLESTSIHLIQSAVVRLLQLFPHRGVTKELQEEYNRQSRCEFELIRDFIILHYHRNDRDDSEFWRDLRAMQVPERITRKMSLFRANGTLEQDAQDLFKEASWLQVMLGQGVMPEDYHPLADRLTEPELKAKLENTRKTKQQPLEQILGHDEFLRTYAGVP